MLPIRVPFRLTLLIVLWSAEGYYDQTIDVTSLADMRADLCDVSAQLTAGNISIRESLKGKRLTFVHALDYPYDWYYEDEDGTPHGFHSDLADALSRAAGFEYTVERTSRPYSRRKTSHGTSTCTSWSTPLTHPSSGGCRRLTA